MVSRKDVGNLMTPNLIMFLHYSSWSGSGTKLISFQCSKGRHWVGLIRNVASSGPTEAALWWWKEARLDVLPQFCAHTGWTVSDLYSRFLITCSIRPLTSADSNEDCQQKRKREKKKKKKIGPILLVMFFNHISAPLISFILVFYQTPVKQHLCERFAASLMWGWLTPFGPLSTPLPLSHTRFL